MFSENTRISEIRSFFECGEDKESFEKKELIKSIQRYNDNKGRGSNLQKIIQSDKKLEKENCSGISYGRAFDFLFFLILSAGNNYSAFSDYEMSVRKRADAAKNGAFFFLTKEKNKGAVTTVLNSIKVSIDDNEFYDLTLMELSQRIDEDMIEYTYYDGMSTHTRLDKVQKKALNIAIQMLYTPLPERYLAQNGFHWCREERQIALFLYNVLLEKRLHDKISDTNLFEKEFMDVFDGEKIENVVIDQVYYEASIMRDYFNHLEEPQKRDFNIEVLKYCLIDDELGNADKSCYESDVDELVRRYKRTDGKEKSLFGGKSSLIKSIKGGAQRGDERTLFNYNDKKNDERIKFEQRIYFATMMVNATPDILVIYHYDGEDIKRAKILECKYLSDVGGYEDYKPGRKTISQKLLQEMIMVFLFGPMELPNMWKIDGICDPLKLYHSNVVKWNNQEESKRWFGIYDFCNRVLTKKNTQGYFNKFLDDKNCIKNMGVVEIDFREKTEKEKTKKKKTGDMCEGASDAKKAKERVVVIKAEDLIDYVYTKRETDSL